MTIRCQTVLVPLLVAATGVSLSADKVRLKSGKAVDGIYMGGDSKAVRVLLDNGRVAQFPIEDTTGVDFTPRQPPPQPPAPAPKPAAAPQRPEVLVPAGTAINVRLTQNIDVDASQSGMTFKAIVDDPVMMGGQIVVPREATAVLQAVKVEQSGTMKGSDKISLKMNSIAFGGMSYPVVTSYVETKGKGEGRRTARKVGGGLGLGALVGGIAGGGEGAAIGAAVGGITGAAVASGGEEHLKLPAETRLTFQLSAAVKVRP
jgi:hypothetical protein